MDHRPKASSKKTRIETDHRGCCGFSGPDVRRRVPKKQGLKPLACQTLPRSFSVRRRVPKKQGLKRCCIRSYVNKPISPKASSKKTRIETAHGHVQGMVFLEVRRRVPKKQGLKPHFRQLYRNRKSSPKASSKKTRIETN